MSYGLVICSKCKKEVHQEKLVGEQTSRVTFNLKNIWMHCEDTTTICKGAEAVFPKSRSEIVGKPCMKDEPPFSPIPINER